MPGKTELELEFGIDLDSDNLDIRKGIEAGIRVEEKQMLFYSHMTEVLHNDEITRFFEFLAGEKRLQKEILEKLKKSLQEKDKWIRVEYDPGDIEGMLEKAQGMRNMHLRMDAGDADVIKNAMKNEEKARKFYEKFADRLRGDGNDFFHKLAEREEKHHDLLSEILESLTSSGLELK